LNTLKHIIEIEKKKSRGGLVSSTALQSLLLTRHLLDVVCRLPDLATGHRLRSLLTAAPAPGPGALHFVELDVRSAVGQHLEHDFTRAVLRIARVGNEAAATLQSEHRAVERRFDVPLFPAVLVLGKDHVNLFADAELEGLTGVDVTAGDEEHTGGGGGEGRIGAGGKRRLTPLALVLLGAASVAQSVGEVGGQRAAADAFARNVEGVLTLTSCAESHVDVPP